eukprot:Gb_02277 [translate_table: standard]
MSDTRPSICNNNTYASGRKFASNLNRLLEDLVQKTSETGFNTSSYGESPNKVYGLLQCRGDASQQQCYNCSLEAKTSVKEICANRIGGRVWLEMCFVRYEKYSFFSVLDTQGPSRMNIYNVTNEASKNPTWRFLTKLSIQTSEPTNKGFAVGSDFHFSNEFFGLVQCWRDISLDDCKTCLSNATDFLYKCCSQCQGAQALLGSCTVRYDIYPFFNSAKVTPENPSKKLPIILGLVGGMFLTWLIICLFAMRSKLKCTTFGNHIIPRQGEAHEDISNSVIGQHEKMVFSLKTLKAATDNFHRDKKLGEGGFGPVYKGRLLDGNDIAVKKLSVRSVQGKREFMNEVKLVAKIQHRNLVKLLGCCSEGPEKLLVYEYLPNKSLDTILFLQSFFKPIFTAKYPERRKLLDWEKRYNIIIGIVRGLLYLHQDSQPRIIHRDTKASNILLDENLNPKIADFGLAKIFPDGESHVSTRVAGTYLCSGYMAPEYAMQGQLSVKVDLYSFGVVLLEIVSGRKNMDFALLPEMQSLLGWSWRLHKEGHIVDMIDQTLVATCSQEQALRCLQVGLLCAQADAAIRPRMCDVVSMLNSCEKLPDPKKPSFLKYVNHNRNSTGSCASRELHRTEGLSQTFSRSLSSSQHHNAVAPSRNDVSALNLSKPFEKIK